MPHLIDLTNKKFGRLTVLSKGTSKHNHTYWKCKCKCGSIKEVRTDGLTSGLVVSCGCYMREIATKLAGKLKYWKGKKRGSLPNWHKKAISNGNTGKKRTVEQRKRLSIAKGGDGSLETKGYPVEWDYKLKSFIRKRDKHRCKMCGDKGCKHQLDVHHIDYNKYNCSPDNLITLCKSCHALTSQKKRRAFYQEYLPTLLIKN